MGQYMTQNKKVLPTESPELKNLSPVISVLTGRDSNTSLSPLKFPPPPFVSIPKYHLASVQKQKDGRKEALWLCMLPQITSDLGGP